MINRKETTTALAIVCIALLATVITMPSPALALGHWNLDKDPNPSSEFAGDDMDSSRATDNTDGEEEDNSDEDSTAALTDEDDEKGSEDSSDDSNDQDPSSVAYEEFQGCLSDITEEGSPTEQEVQECMESAYSGIDSDNNIPTKSTDDGDEDENSITEHVSTDDTEDE